MNEDKLDFSKRYMAGHGTSIFQTFATAAELNAWHDAQDTDGRYFCSLYDTEKHISVLGSAYMFYNESQKWKDEPVQAEKRPSVVEKLGHKASKSPNKAKAPKNKEPER